MNNTIKKGKPNFILYILAIIGVALIIYRFMKGLGPVTNLSDGYPWGLWIGIDVMSGVALAAGGFTLAAIVHIFGMKKYYSVIRPAILTAFLGYIFVIIGLLIDLGRSIEIWHAIVYWNNTSAMFEVAWCVMLYTTVLALEFLPVVFEKYNMKGLQKLYDIFTPIIANILVSFFVYLMTGVLLYTIIIFVLLLIFILLYKFTLPKGSTILILFIAGVIYSFAHQASLGSLFLIVPTKLAALWYTSTLPIYYILTAIGVGLAMVIFESVLSSKNFGFGLEENVIKGLGKFLFWMLLIIIVFRFVTLDYKNGFSGVVTGKQQFYFWLEIIIGLILPFIMLLLPSIKKSVKAIFWAATLYIAFGVILNRINCAYIGMNSPEYTEGYFPHIFEILTTLGIISIGVIIFVKVCNIFPVFVHHKEE